MFENNKLCLQNVLLEIILQYVPEGSGSWKYNHYFPVAKGEGKIPLIMSFQSAHAVRAFAHKFESFAYFLLLFFLSPLLLALLLLFLLTLLVSFLILLLVHPINFRFLQLLLFLILILPHIKDVLAKYLAAMLHLDDLLLLGRQHPLRDALLLLDNLVAALSEMSPTILGLGEALHTGPPAAFHLRTVPNMELGILVAGQTGQGHQVDQLPDNHLLLTLLEKPGDGVVSHLDIHDVAEGLAQHVDVDCGSAEALDTLALADLHLDPCQHGAVLLRRIRNDPGHFGHPFLFIYPSHSHHCEMLSKSHGLLV